MNQFEVHTMDSAPEQSQPLLQGAKQAFGFIPNLLGVFAESPATLEAYLQLADVFDKSSFSPIERQVVILAISRYNECEYCVAAHTIIAGRQKVSDDIVQAIREDRAIDDARLETLRQFTTKVIDGRGWVSDDDVEEFLAAGFSRAQMLEIVLGISFKTLSNYVNHMAGTPLDSAFAPAAWQVVASSQPQGDFQAGGFYK